MAFISFLKKIFRENPAKICLLVLCIILAGALEGVGFILFIPLIKLITTPASSAGLIGSGGIIQKFFMSFCSKSPLYFILAFIVIIVILKNIFLYYEKIVTARISTDFEVRLKKTLSTSVFASDWQFYLNQKIGTLINAFTTAVYQSGLAFYITSQLCAEILNITIYCILGLLISWQAFLMSMIVGLIYVIFSKNIIRASRSVGQDGVGVENQLNSSILEDFTGIKFIKGNYLEEQRKKNLFGLIDRFRSVVLRREKYFAILDTFPEVVMVATMCIVLYLSCTRFHVPGENLLVMLALLYRFNRRVMTVQTLRQRFMHYIPSYELSQDIIKRAEELKEHTGEKIFGQLDKGIVFNEVGFSYHEHLVLSSVTFEISKNKFVAFVGKSGIGKSTILDLVVGLLKPQRGRISIDGNSINDYNIFSFRQRIGYVPQEVFLINGTVLENILMGNLEATEQEIINAAKMAHADEFIRRMPQQYNTIVGERGIKLSGGQRQRIALARALVRKPEILILDEATSALDNESESMVQRAINELKGKLTIIVVAHRLTTIQDADKIYVVSEGKIVESGTMMSLRESSTVFKEIYLKH